ncbi:penicillin-binding transpeptidase domain-containing protein, partial [Streptomyces sp. ND04-05B]
QWNSRLSGKDGKIRYAQSGGRLVPTAGSTETPAVAGSDVELTIDRDIQWAAQNAISEQVKKSRADRGYVIVQDTRTGEVLAMANSPGFDPNDLTKANPDALGNAALQDAYEPGSTAKVMSMAAVLEENVATPGTHVTVPNRLHRGDRLFKDDIDHPTWYLTLNGVLAKSSNIGTILATGELGRNQRESNRILYSYLRKFGLGSYTGLGFPGETKGILAAPGDWSTSQQYTIPFGQGVSMNAMQAASVYSTIANGGVRVEPTLVRGTKGPDGRFTPSPEPGKSRVVSEKTA